MFFEDPAEVMFLRGIVRVLTDYLKLAIFEHLSKNANEPDDAQLHTRSRVVRHRFPLG